MNLNITETEIKFAVHMWRTVYVIKSQFGHFLWKDGHIHDDAGLGTSYNGAAWEDRVSAEDFLETWNGLHDFRRTETLTVKKSPVTT